MEQTNCILEPVITLPSENLEPPIPFKKGTYILVSKVAYLLGVSARIFENIHEPPQKEIYDQLEQNVNARIIRNLCRLRTAMEKNFKAINDQMRFEYKTLYLLPDLIPLECIDHLYRDGVRLSKSNHFLVQHIIEVNRFISDRINNCKDIFPLWINWNYIRELFIMPDGLNETGAARAAAVYYEHKAQYPYQVYLNWPPSEEGNILFSDKKFVTLLYQWHDDRFSDYSKVSDVGDQTKNSIYDFLLGSGKTVIVVDCENSDPYKLCSALKNLDDQALTKIEKIILYDDIHTAPSWSLLDTYLTIPVEHILIERLKPDKSLVDIRLTGGAFREFYQHQVDSFIIVSSDSDYWGLISALPEARFLVMVEHGKCGPDIKAALEENRIFYCYLDDFYSGDIADLKRSALLKETRKYLDQLLNFNVYHMMEEVYRITRIDMDETEKQQFYHRYIKPMQLTIEKDGTISIELRGK